MPYTIDLSPEEEAYLRKMAAERGQTPEEYAIELIIKALDADERKETAEQTAKTDAQSWKG